MEVTIKRAVASDLNTLLELMHAQLAEHEIDIEPDQLRAALARLISDSSLGLVLTAKVDHRLVGFAAVSFAWTLEHGGRSAWLDELYVVPHHRNTGIGSTLIEHVLVQVKEEGCQAVDLEVDLEHRRAENLYRRKGFRRLERNRWARRIR